MSGSTEEITVERPLEKHDEIAILDFGSQYTHIIARRLRECSVFCEIHSCEISAQNLVRNRSIRGLILSGGPASVYDEDAPHVSRELWELAEERQWPILGICYGFQEMVHHSGGKVEYALEREYGLALVEQMSDAKSGQLFENIPSSVKVWMSHGDKIVKLPERTSVLAKTENTQFAVVAWSQQDWYGIQFHPEVSHTEYGRQLLQNFCINICNVHPNWTMESFVDDALEEIRLKVGPDAHVIGAVSGGVDSTVAAALMTQAIGKRFHAILVDNGVMREHEVEEVQCRLTSECGVDLRVVDAAELFLSRLRGIEDPETKRTIIGNTFVEVFEEEAKKLTNVEYLLQGTLYPDVIESVSFKGPSKTIKTHHNVGGLSENMKLKVIEPLRELFKDEVRELGKALGLPHDSLFRHPFPGPGLAIRIIGAVDEDCVDTLRRADAIYVSELRSSGEYDNIAQAFAALLPCRSVGVMGDNRTYEKVIALRAVQTTDYMTADWYRFPYDVLARVSTRIINEVPGVNRVTYDISSKPPATIEWE
eukprot:gb/GECG01003033.1/.p1 GENE.gb/GECG01003033.1/~~gb/GECG01003033.1/.p1  ORF type:complete len:536 (+),score=62.42 gb/GECG01003033.1/:1-1608(+)